MLKKLWFIALILLLMLIVWHYDIISYGLAQAKGQFTILWKARNITEVLHDPLVADSIKARIQMVQEIKQFATDQIGVKPTDNYTTFYDQQGKPILWVLTACKPYELKNKEWSFPFIGSFSYKGFFDRERAIQERAQLDDEGFDTGIRTTTAWSTLGYFKDPILSGFLSRSEGEIANTVIHELTHGTVFVKDSLQFNENIATFFGNKGAEAFLTQKYGASSEEYKAYIDRMHDREIYTRHILRGAGNLDSLYHAFDTWEEAAKQPQKENLIRQIIYAADTLSLRDKPQYDKLFQRFLQPDSLPNNTFFMSYMRYRGSLEALEQECNQQFGGNVKAYLQYLAEKY